MIKVDRTIEDYESMMSDSDWRRYCKQVERFKPTPFTVSVRQLKLRFFIRFGYISFAEHDKLEASYVGRNPNIHAYFLGNRHFGEDHIGKLLAIITPEIKPIPKKIAKANKWKYDFLLYSRVFKTYIKISFGASRATDKKSEEELIWEKSLKKRSKKPFTMNFQHLKVSCGDVFVWAGIWTNYIKFWVLAPYQLTYNEKYQKTQARGNKGEGQIHITNANMHKFEKYVVQEADLVAAIREAYVKQRNFEMYMSLHKAKEPKLEGDYDMIPGVGPKDEPTHTNRIN